MVLIIHKIIESWCNISLLNENIKIDEFCLMPNHIHGIIIIENGREDDLLNLNKPFGLSTQERRGRRSLPGLVKDFKSVTTRHYNKIVEPSLMNALWQKSYFEHVIRNERELKLIREYIQNNPVKWHEDKYFNT